MINPSTINPAALPSVALNDRRSLPSEPCIYFAIDAQGVVQYIGQSINPRCRWRNHHRASALAEMESVRISYLRLEANQLKDFEDSIIDRFTPTLNKVISARRKILVGKLPELRSRLPELMEASGIDQKTLAAQTGLSPTTVGKLYRNHMTAIDFPTVETLLKHFKLTRLDDLIEVVIEESDNA